MLQPLKNLSNDAKTTSLVTSATRNEALPTLQEFLNAHGSKWCRIQIKPNKVLMSFRDSTNHYHYGSGSDLFTAFSALLLRVTSVTA